MRSARPNRFSLLAIALDASIAPGASVSRIGFTSRLGLRSASRLASRFISACIAAPSLISACIPRRVSACIPRLGLPLARPLALRLEFLWGCTGPRVRDHVLSPKQHGCVSSTGLCSAGLHLAGLHIAGFRNAGLRIAGLHLAGLRSSGSSPTVAPPFSAAPLGAISAILRSTLPVRFGVLNVCDGFRITRVSSAETSEVLSM